MKFTICFFVFAILLSPAIAQVSNYSDTYHKKGSFSFHWGYNRSYYSKTNLHVTGPDYDVTFYDLKGTDRPSEFGVVYFNPVTFTIPQYTFRLAYYITDKLAISGGMDHMKYVVMKNQWTIISGVVTPEASTTYEGSYLNESIQLTPDILMFEHTNGFNLVSIDFEYLQPLFEINKAKLNFYWNTGAGGIWIITKTDVRVFGQGLDNDFHVSGYAFVGKTGPRMEYNNRFYLGGELKGGYASLPSVLIANDAPEIGDHNLSFLEYYIVAGVNFDFKKKDKRSDAK